MQESYTISHATRALAQCRNIFAKKLTDYGASWRIMRPMSITDQLFIKAKRIRTLETDTAMVDEGILPEFMALVNYGIIGLIQLDLGYADCADISPEKALALYDNYVRETLDLMTAKTHDYGDAWRDMRVVSFTDIILTKIQRIKQIENNDGETLISEGIDSNLMDIINYALFAIIKLNDGEE
ncbi:MAG: DUF1599 domain-containing protein [Barnesiella sp.]|nr:DUF1599 domain-containing protein [Barnesiella sp.]MBD5253452.1 DUF1599 domain-containing protein [Barnesiella sp.]MBD5344513.1 DUF1599 domain-containing protein [Bacteroides sp.]MDE5829502.1 DUF1599 domain-containing protein [Duncaniella sp.]